MVNKSVLIVLGVFGLGIIVGKSLSVQEPASTISPAPPNFPNPSANLRPIITEAEYREYLGLKSLRERYLKADELLGKVILALIADFGMRVSKETESDAKMSASGRRELEKFEAPDSGKSSITDESTSEKQAALVTEVHLPASKADQAFPKQGNIPFRSTAIARSRNFCGQGESSWFKFFDGREYDVQVVEDSTGNGIATLFSLKENRNSSAQFDHCGNIPVHAGKKYALRAFVKAEGVRSGDIHINGQTSALRMTNRSGRKKFSGTFDWTGISVEFVAPPDARQLVYGMTLEGEGKVSMRQVLFEEVP